LPYLEFDNWQDFVLLFRTAGVGTGRIWPAKQSHPARSLFANCSNFMAHPVVLHFMNLPSLPLLVLHTYEEPQCAINVLYVLFWAFVMKCENKE